MILGWFCGRTAILLRSMQNVPYFTQILNDNASKLFETEPRFTHPERDNSGERALAMTAIIWGNDDKLVTYIVIVTVYFCFIVLLFKCVFAYQIVQMSPCYLAFDVILTVGVRRQ